MQSGLTRLDAGELEAFCRQALTAGGADAATAEAASRAMLHASRLGIDSHGVRLLPHYVRVIEGGRVNGRPALSFVRSFGATSVLDADNAHGALATYTAMQRAVELARLHGLGAVAIRRSSHFGAAGAYALRAAEAGLIGFCTGNSDRIVRLHGGATPFHGTNPLAVAVPVRGDKPWLFDMATSAIPFNRVELFASLGRALPAGVASDAEGRDTIDPGAAKMLAPLGGEFGFKGAGLAGLAEILSAALTGMGLSMELAAMGGPDYSTPRGLGAFVLAIEPHAFVEEGVFDQTMRRYLRAVRQSRALPDSVVMAPGDREWKEAEVRLEGGIPVDPETLAAFQALAARFGFPAPNPRP